MTSPNVVGQQPDHPVTAAAHAVAVDKVAHVKDLRAAGISDHRINTRCRSGGPWQRLFSQVVLLHNRPPTRRQQLRAVLARLGEDAVITGVDALRELGADLPEWDAPIHVLVPENCRVQCGKEIVIERTTRVPRPIDAGGLAVAPPARATVDAARQETSPSRLQTILLAPIKSNLCELAAIHAELEHGSQRGAAAPRRYLHQLGEKLRSLGEQRARRLIASSQLPPPLWNVSVTDASGGLLAVVVAHWPEAGLSWDISQDGFQRATLAGAGLRVVHTPPSELLREPAAVRRRLLLAYQAACRDQAQFGEAQILAGGAFTAVATRDATRTARPDDRHRRGPTVS